MGVFGELPSLRDLENPKSNQASEIIADDGKTVLGTWYWQNRSPDTVILTLDATGAFTTSTTFDETGEHDRPIAAQK